MDTRRMTLGELRHIIREMYDEGDSIVLDASDIESCLTPSKEPITGRSSVSAVVPFNYATPTPAPIKRLGLTSRDALATLKRPVQSTDKKTVKASNKAFYAIIDKLARPIVGYVRQHYPGIDVIVYAASSADMTWYLAEELGQRLGVPVVGDAFVKKQAHEHDIENDWFAEWARGKDPEDVELLRGMLDKHVAEFRRTGKLTQIKSLPFQWRQFFNVHKPGPGISQLRGKQVLVVDDNIDKGFTFAGLQKLLMQAGVDRDDIKYAAGFKYSSRESP